MGTIQISPSMTRETELPVGLKVLDDRASINSFPSPSSSSPIPMSMGKGMGDEDADTDIIPVMIGETRQGAAVLSTNELVTGQPDVVDLLDESETYREEPVVGDFCAALDGWYNYCDNCYHNRGNDHGHDVEEILYNCVDEQTVIDTFLRQLADYAVDGRSAYSTSNVLLAIADTGMEVLPRIKNPDG